MKTIPLIVGMFPLVLGGAAWAEAIRLADGTTLEGTLGAPTEVAVQTATGEKKVAFAMLSPEQQRVYWPKAAEVKLAAAEVTAATIDDELASLANEVNLETWEQVTAIGSFRDKAEKRGSGGLVTTKAFNAIEENWVSVYSPKDAVGLAGNWTGQMTRAKALQGSAQQFVQKRWLELFVKAGDAVARRDSNDFALVIRELKRSPLNVAGAENSREFFTAK